MTLRTRHILLLLGLLAPALGQAAADWSKLKVGITPEEATKALGEPLLRRNSRGIDVWIYDGSGEVVFAGGPLLGWTLAAPSAESLSRPVERDVIFRPPPRRRSTSIILGGVNSQPVIREDPFDTRFRYRR